MESYTPLLFVPVRDHSFLLGQLGQGRVHTQRLRGAGDEVGFREIAVLIIACLGEGELRARLDPLRAVVRDAQTLSDLVRGLEAAPLHVSGQPIWLVLDDRNRGIVVGLVDAQVAIAVHPGRIFVTNSGANAVSVLDARSGTVLRDPGGRARPPGSRPSRITP